MKNIGVILLLSVGLIGCGQKEIELEIDPAQIVWKKDSQYQVSRGGGTCVLPFVAKNNTDNDVSLEGYFKNEREQYVHPGRYPVSIRVNHNAHKYLYVKGNASETECIDEISNNIKQSDLIVFNMKGDCPIDGLSDKECSDIVSVKIKEIDFRGVDFYENIPN